MALKFDYTINLTEGSQIDPSVVEQSFITNEPNGQLIDYFLKEKITKEKIHEYTEMTDYNNLHFNKKDSKMTNRYVDKIGVKSFPGMGSYGFYKDRYTGISSILIPINIDRKKLTAPTLTMTRVGDELEFTIKNPIDAEYKCYRVVFYLDGFTYEYVSYEPKFTCPIPDVKGTYDIYCFGYTDEGANVSENSKTINFTVETGQDSFAPNSEVTYYTKKQIDEMMGQIGILLDKLNGVVI